MTKQLPLIFTLVVCLSAACLAPLPALAETLPRAEPEQVGMSAPRLARLDTVIRQHVDDKKIAGAVTLVARRGKIVHLGFHGMADIEDNRPITADTIFRIASMTKPITSAAVMMLYEEGKFLLNDPVSNYLPEFANPRVLPGPDASNNYREPARGPIRIRHLLTHTAGLTYHWNEKLGPLYNSYQIPHGLGPTTFTTADFTRELAKLPLLFHPGDRFEYGLNIDVLGRLVEVASGQTLDEFFRERILEPLDMNDTHFYLPPGKQERLAAVYGSNDSDPLERVEGEISVGAASGTADYPYSGPRKFFSGGGGLSSTAPDYARFAQMILNKGELDGVRLLSPPTVELMTMDHLGSIVEDPPLAFGLGFSIDLAKNGFTELTSEGTHGWGGFWFTEFFISPEHEMIGVFMAQLFPSNGLQLRDKFKTLAHQAIVE